MTSSSLATRLGLRYPILQAPIGSMVGIELAAATCNAGALGSLALTWTEPQVAAELVHQLRQQVSTPFFVNFVLAFQPLALDSVLDAGAPIITFSWGDPAELVEKVHSHGALVGAQVGSPDGARRAVHAGADFIICQGVEAGGHVQSTLPLSVLLPLVHQIVANVPVLAAGGLADGRQIASALASGADGVMLGTRFVATQESRAHPLYKEALVRASSRDAVLTTCFEGGWPYAPHRVLRNSTLIDWESAGCPPVGRRPGEGQVVATSPAGKIVDRYDDTPPAFDMQGDVLSCCLYSGLGCDSISDIPPVSELLPRLWSETQANTINAA